MTYSIEGIILNSRDIKEVDRIYSVFSREKGKQQIVGIGTRRAKARLASGLEPMTKSEIFLVKARGLDKVKGVIILNQYENIKNSIEKISQAQKVIKIVDWMTQEDEPNKEVYEVLKSYLKALDESVAEADSVEKVRLELIKLTLFWKIIVSGGIQPELFRCSNCQSKLVEQERYSFIVPSGVECQKCSSQNSLKISIGQNTIKILRLLLQEDLKVILKLKVSSNDVNQLVGLTQQTLQAVLDRKVLM